MPPYSPDPKERPAAHAAGAATNPAVRSLPVTDPHILRRQAYLDELTRQGDPLLSPGDRSNASRFFAEGTTRSGGLRPETVHRYKYDSTAPDAFFVGSHPKGKAAEVIAACETAEALAGRPTHLKNAPPPAPRVSRVRLNPDPTAIRDLIYEIPSDSGTIIFRPGPQVKNGTPQYIVRRAMEDAAKPGYARVYVVDSRLANADGTPRISPDAFTKGQAKRLQDAGYRLQGVDDLETFAEHLLDDAAAWHADRLTPEARASLDDLRGRLAQAYRGRAVVGRVLGAGAVAFTAATLATIVHQAIVSDQIDLKAALADAVPAGVVGASGVAADAASYHVLTRVFGMSPEAAQAASAQAVAAGFCLVAIVADASAEVDTARRGERSALDAAAGTALKGALNVLPLALGPVGLLAIPITLAAQAGGRWGIHRVRALSEETTMAVDDALKSAEDDHNTDRALSDRMDRLEHLLRRECTRRVAA